MMMVVVVDSEQKRELNKESIVSVLRMRVLPVRVLSVCPYGTYASVFQWELFQCVPMGVVPMYPHAMYQWVRMRLCQCVRMRLCQ